MRKRLILFFIIMVVACIGLTACGAAVETEKELPKGHYKFENCTFIISDEIGMFTSLEEETIVKQLTPYLEKANCDVMLRTIAVNEEPYLIQADNLHHYFDKESTNWVALTYNRAERHTVVDVNGEEMEEWLPVDDRYAMMKAGDNHLEYHNYPKALAAMLEAGLKTIAKNGGTA